MFQENNIHTKIARNEFQVFHYYIKSKREVPLIHIESVKSTGKGNRFMRRLNKLIAENKIDKFKLVKNHFIQDFVFLTTLLYTPK